MASPIRIISSMATKQVLTDLIALYRQAHPDTVIELESVGGVDAARRVAAGERFDVVVMPSAASMVKPGASSARPCPGAEARACRARCVAGLIAFFPRRD